MWPMLGIAAAGILLVAAIGIFSPIDPAQVRKQTPRARSRWTPRFVFLLAMLTTLTAVLDSASGLGFVHWLNAGIWWLLCLLLVYEKRTSSTLWRRRDESREEREQQERQRQETGIE